MIPFCDLRPALEPIRKDIDAAIARVINSGVFLNGDEVAAFEEEWAKYCETEHAVACGSGTDALTLAADASGYREFEVQANTLPFTKIGLENGGAKVTVRDVQKNGVLYDSTKPVPVTLYGRYPLRHELHSVIIDACQAHGWKPGAWNGMACWSFYPTKNLGCFGDSGCVTTNDSSAVYRMREQRHRLHSRMSEIQAAVLRVKLPHLDEWNRKRAEIAGWYWNEMPPVMGGALGPFRENNSHIFALIVNRRDELKRHLSERGIGTKIHYERPLEFLPQASLWCSRVLSLPMYVGMTAEQVREVCDTIRSFN